MTKGEVGEGEQMGRKEEVWARERRLFGGEMVTRRATSRQFEKCGQHLRKAARGVRGCGRGRGASEWKQRALEALGGGVPWL